jgi:CopG family nickel-responsive transcriptional regulator
MKELVRFGVSIDDDLLEKFDSFIEHTGYRNRSEAFRDLIRARLLEEELNKRNKAVYAVLTVVYNHDKPQLAKKLTAIQHEYGGNIIVTNHLHLNEGTCMEVLLLKGKAEALENLRSSLSVLKGVEHSKLVFTALDNEQTSTHHHHHEHKHH